MGRHTIALALALIAAPLAAQGPGLDTPTLRGFRWYVAPNVQVTTLNGETAVLTGFEFGWMKTDRLTLGLAAYRLANGVVADRPDPTGVRDVEFFYSGILAEYAMCAHPGFRMAPRLLVGGAEAHWREDYWNGMPDPDHRDELHTTSFVAEPGVSVELALAPWIRADLMGAYRFVGGGESNVIEQSDMRGFSATLGIRLGQF
jgi:hypothetical protein